MLANMAKKDEWPSADDNDVLFHQQALSRTIDEACYNSLITTAPDTCSHALARSTAISHTGDWLSVVPCTTPHLHFHNQEFRLCV